MKTTLFAVAIAIASADHLELELVATFTELENGGTIESCHYDGSKNLWRFLDISDQGDMCTLPGSYPSSTTFEPSVQDPSLNGTGSMTRGIQFVANDEVGDRLYIANSGSGDVLIYDIADEDVTDFIEIGPPGTNGLCYDADNDVLYVTNPGFNPFNRSIDVGRAGIYKVEAVSTSSRSVTSIPVTPIVDQDGVHLNETNEIYIERLGTDRVFMPNGCDVMDGKVYFAESRTKDARGALGIYNIETDSFYVNTQVIDQKADGLVAFGGYLITSVHGVGSTQADPVGTLWTYDTTDPDAVFEIALDELVRPGDFGMNDDDVLCVPRFLRGSAGLYFVQVTEHVDFSSTELMEDMSTTQEDDNEESGDIAMSVVMAVVVACVCVVLQF